MAIQMFARGGQNPVLATADTAGDETTELRKELAVVLDELDIANARADREEREAMWLRESLRDAEAVLEMLEPVTMPQLAAYHPAPFDEPIPAAGEPWPPVPGDRASDWPPVEPVDFAAVYALIGAEMAEATA